MSEGTKLWHIIKMILYSVITSFLALSAGLFGYAHALSKGKNFGCLLFRDGQGYNFNYSACNFSISGAALSAVGFAVLINFTGIKLGYSRLRNSCNALLAEIAILVISSLFAVVTAIVLIVGWRITCDNVQGQGDNVEGQGSSTSSNETIFICSSQSDIAGPATASMVFSCFAIFLMIQIFIFIIYKFFNEEIDEESN